MDRIYVSGALTLENRFIILPDPMKVLLEEELVGLAGLGERTRAVEDTEEIEKGTETERGNDEKNPDR